MDREKILKWIDEHTIELGITNYPYVSAIDLKEILSSQWISVEDRLVELFKPVINEDYLHTEVGDDNILIYMPFSEWQPIKDWLRQQRPAYDKSLPAPPEE